MNDQSELSALRRKAGAGRAPSDGVGMTPAKAFRLATSKAAQVELGLAVRIQSIKEQQLNQSQLLDALDGEALLLMLEGPDGGRGIAVFDMQAVSALIEVQTLGMVIASEATARSPTRTDSAMCEAMLDRVLQEFEGHLADGNASVWATGFRFAKQIDSLRLMGLALEDIPYRMFHLQLDMADGAKQGMLQIAFPAQGGSRKRSAAGGDGGWAQAMESVVGDSHVGITAVLHRTQKSLAEVRMMQVGDEVLLPNSAISAVSMEGSDGCIVGAARLGQKNGYKALRISGIQSDLSILAEPVADLNAPDMPDELDAPFHAADIPMPAFEGEGGDPPDLPMMPMESEPMETIDDLPMAAPMDAPMNAMPMDIEIA